MSDIVLIKYSELLADYKKKIIHCTSCEFDDCVRLISEKSIELHGALYNYIANAIKSAPGEKIIIIEYSKRLIYLVEVETVSKKLIRASYHNISLVYDMRLRKYSCYVSMMKAGKNEEALERLTEIGADEICFFRSSRSIGAFGEAKLERLQKIAVSASSQARRISAPIVKISDFSSVIEKIESCDASFFFLAEPSLRLMNDSSIIKSAMEGLKQTERAISIVSGPEGGFSREEIERMSVCFDRKNKVGLSAFYFCMRGAVLRAELAPQVALGIIKYNCGDF